MPRIASPKDLQGIYSHQPAWKAAWDRENGGDPGPLGHGCTPDTPVWGAPAAAHQQPWYWRIAIVVLHP